MSTQIIQMTDIKKIYYTEDLETHALSGINLNVEKGEFLSISGPSGCGKSTLLSIMGLLDTPSSGEYILAGEDVSNLSKSQQADTRNHRIGFIFQSFNLISDLNVFENIELPLIYRGIGKQARKERVNAVLDKVEMGHRNNHFPRQLSGGQQQRVAIARALVGEPELLLADEPTGNLDSTNGKNAMELLTKLHDEGATICMVTHDQHYNSLASRVVHLLDGSVTGESQ